MSRQRGFEHNSEMNCEQDNYVRLGGFNQGGSCFAVVSEAGFTLFNSCPLSKSVERKFPENCGTQSIRRVEMLFRTNLMAFIGASSERATSRSRRNKVLFWDDLQQKIVGELSFPQTVLAVHLRRDCIIVVLQFKLHLYRLVDLVWMDTVSTCNNELALCSVSQAIETCVVAY